MIVSFHKTKFRVSSFPRLYQGCSQKMGGKGGVIVREENAHWISLAIGVHLALFRDGVSFLHQLCEQWWKRAIIKCRESMITCGKRNHSYACGCIPYETPKLWPFEKGNDAQRPQFGAHITTAKGALRVNMAAKLLFSTGTSSR